VPATAPRIFLGDCERARAKELDVTALKRDGFYRAVIEGDLYILGRDDPEPRWHRGGWVEFARLQHGTINGVYDLLEDVCGVRWFMAGKLGQVVPRHRVVTVPAGLIKEEPVFMDRRTNQMGIHFYRYPDAKEICESDAERHLWALRLRWATINPVPSSHSVTHLKFGERFGREHPEWFALRADGTRAIKTGYGEHLCWSHPKVVETFTADAHAYFTVQAPQSRGLDRWYGHGIDSFMVDPSDSYTKCRCERCRETLRAYPGQDYSEIMFSVVAKVADSVKDLEGKYITTLAYPPKPQAPKSVKLPKNVRIQLAISGSNAAMRPLANESQMKLMKEWNARMEGDLVLWTYPLVSWYESHLIGAVETMSHAISDFLKAARPYISGVFFQNNAITETYRALDTYIMMRLAWDPRQDVDALLEDYFSKFYGPAGDAIQALYARLEEDWKRIMTFYPEPPSAHNRWIAGPYGTASRVDLGEQVYTEEELARFDAWLQEAEANTADLPEVAARVALLRKRLYETLVRQRSGFQDTLGQASVAKVRVERTSAGWTVEMALALERLGISDPTAAKQFGLNVVRHRAIKEQESEFYGWSPRAGPGGWTDPTLFGSIRFVNKKPRRLGKELITNGSFEKTGTGDQPFAGWTVYHYPEGQGSVRGAGSTAHRDEVTRWDGKTSLRCEGGNEASPFYTVSIYHYPRGLKPDTRYRFRCRVKTEDVKVRTSGHKGVYVNFYVPVVHRFDPNPGLTGSGDWRTIEYTVRTAKEFGDAPKFYFILKFQEATGKAWFDAVSLREILSE